MRAPATDPRPDLSSSSRASTATRDLVAATRRYAGDQPAQSWRHLIVTLAVLAACLSLAALLPAPWRAIGSIAAAFVMVRAFIMFHDHMHGAILRRSTLGRILLRAYGCLILTPPSAWRKTHDFHHAHVGRVEHSEIGGYHLMTVEQWRDASRWSRLVYRVARGPIVMLLAYPVVFGGSITAWSFFSDPRRHWDAGVSLLAHGGLIAALWVWGGFSTAFYMMLLPMTVASMLGAYLFYAQHSFEGAKVVEGECSIAEASLANASYLKMGPLMRWLTGDIGYHHVHHLNAAIPFYALHDAMHGIPELARTKPITLRPSDIVAGLRLKLWDSEAGRLVGFGAVQTQNAPLESSREAQMWTSL